MKQVDEGIIVKSRDSALAYIRLLSDPSDSKGEQSKALQKVLMKHCLRSVINRPVLCLAITFVSVLTHGLS
jgi:hypothetical protein